MILTVSEQLRVNPGLYSGPPAADGRRDPARLPLFGWYTDRAGAVAGAFLHTPPHPLLLTAVPAGVAAGLAGALAGRPLAAVNGHVETAREFAATWQAATPGGRATEQRRMRLYRLGELSWPDPAPDGAPRVAAGSDAPLLTGWFAAFADEVHDSDVGAAQAGAVREKLGYGGILIWDAGGRAGRLRGGHPAGGGHAPGRPGLHAAGAPRPRLRQRRHRRGEPPGAGSGGGGGPALHRPGQSHVQFHLPADRLPCGRRPGSAGIFRTLVTGR